MLTLSVWIQAHIKLEHFHITLLGMEEGINKKSKLCKLVKMLKITDGPLIL